ncbi:MAG: amidohydrolase, partial [Lachnospiraceae bacterium]|nr:amidohydrolase [Lachnospiraceae bacterium]
MERLSIQLQAEKEYLIKRRRDFHQYPELSMQEVRTAKVIEEELEKFGILSRRIGETGVLGILRGNGEGNRVVALRADIDALPLVETNTAEYCSLTKGVMHACGHDAHTASLLGAAKVLAANRDSFGGEVRFIFQPGEEIGKGASDFIEAGAMEGVERVFGLHLAPDLPIRTIGVTPELNNAAVDHFRILVKGKATHVSTPQLGADALYAGCQIMVALQGLVSRRTSPVEPVIIGVGKMHSGTTYNAVPGLAEMEGTTRTISEEMRMQVRKWVDETASQTAAISGAEAEAIWTGITPALINDVQVSKEVKAVAEALGGNGSGEIRVITDRPLSLGGDNFAEFQRVVPGCYAYLGTANPEVENSLNSLHNGNFDLDEEALVLGAGLYA